MSRGWLGGGLTILGSALTLGVPTRNSLYFLGMLITTVGVAIFWAHLTRDW